MPVIGIRVNELVSLSGLKKDTDWFASNIPMVGAGKIGEAVARCVASAAIAESVIVTKRNTSTLKFSDRKVRVISDNAEAASKSDVIIIAVKPGDASALCILIWR